jgi:TolB protein
MRNALDANLSITALLIGLLVAGCSTPAQRPAAVTDATSADTGNVRHWQRLWPVDPGGPLLFGDAPEMEQAPLGNRLVTNLRQHTFTVEGLDFDPDIDPAGQTLVFASTRHSERAGLYMKAVEGTALTQLTAGPGEDIQPRFSPDGETIAFCSNRSGNWDIWRIGRDGTGLTQLTYGPADELAPSWSPDGTQVVYTVWGQRSHQWELWTLDVERPGVRRFLAYGMFPSWSPDGTRVAFQRARERGSRWFSIWVVDVVDGEARHPTEFAHSDEMACIAPCWSPDGSMLAYCTVRRQAEDGGSERAPRGADLWSIELESGLRMKLTDGSVPAFNPVWGPDGRIFFVSSYAGTENIWSLTADLASYARGSAAAPRVSRGPASSSHFAPGTGEGNAP